jgi:hypothetical protein
MLLKGYRKAARKRLKINGNPLDYPKEYGKTLGNAQKH